MKMFTIEPQRRKSQMLQLGLFSDGDVVYPQFEDLDLFKVFRDFDEDNKGFLEPSEFYTCLESFKPLGLSPAEITTMTLLCDCEMDMRIDYAEIMKFFRQMLFQVKFTGQLQEKYDNEIRVENDAGQVTITI